MSNSNKKIRVAVLFGGRSGEHEVSLVSASSVIERLNPEKYEVIPIGITKEGRWIAGPDSMRQLKSGKAPSESNVVIPAEPLPHPSPPLSKGRGIDVVFPVLHGPYGEDGTVQGFLELTGLPYVGCGVLGSAVCMDKVMQKKVLASEGFSQAAYVWFWMSQWKENRDASIGRAEKNLTYPMFVKPANLGSSVGISKAGDTRELIAAIEDAGRYDRKIIVEQGVGNPREIECAVLGNQEPRASVPGEIVPSGEFYDYDAKYVDGKSKAIIPADLPADIIKKVQERAVQAFKALDCEGMARVDFLLAENGTLYLNELNTIPGFTSISMYPKLWEASGLAYEALLDELIRLAMERNAEKRALAVSYQPKQDWYNA